MSLRDPVSPKRPVARVSGRVVRKLSEGDERERQDQKRARSERMRKLNADPEFAKAHAERMRKLHADPEFAKAAAERMRKLHADPEFKAKQQAGKDKRHARTLAKRIAAMQAELAQIEKTK